MRKLHYFLLLLLLSSVNLFGQSPARTSIKGVICDSAGINVPSAMVMLLAVKDSALVNFTQANDNGVFEFKNVKNSGYLMKIQQMGFLPYQKTLSVSPTELNDLGKIQLKIIAKMLLEVVIKAARAPLKFRGDTIEYDAASFKVPPGSTVEDLLRRLPGIDVDADGNIKSQGKDVKRLYVEGKSFFGDDPKFATKNLGAEAISKVQFFDEKSEQSKLTGIDDGVKDNKAMNLSLKEAYKKGAFGKLTAAAGDQNRWALKGNYNRFDKVQQLSIIAFGNNINQTGVNWDDYSEFQGQSSSNYDNGDFGFNNNMRIYYYSEGGFTNSYDGRGLTDNYGSGVNYNFDNKKTKFNSSYTYNETTRKLYQTSKKETFLQDNSFKNADTTQNKEFRGNHSIGIRLEHNIDSSNILVTKANINFTNSHSNNSLISLYSDAYDIKTRGLKTINDNKISSWNINSAAIFRHQFKKKGANFAWSGGFNTNKSDGLEDPYSLNRFFAATTFTDQIIALSTNNNTSSTQFKSSMLLTEPLSKVFYWETFYNFIATNNVQDRLTQDAALQNITIDSLTAYYTNTVLYNRLGSTFRYSNKGLNAMIGLAAQQIQIKGNTALRNDPGNQKDPVNKVYSNWVPNASIRYQLTKSVYLNTTYELQISEPSISQLMPIVNVNNPAFIIQGNPELKPQRYHTFGLNSSYFNQAAMSNFFFACGYSIYENRIVTNQTISWVDKVGMQTVSKPANVNGGNYFYWDSQLTYPIIKTKLTINIGAGYSFGNAPAYVNGIENITNNKRYVFMTTFNLTPSQKLVLTLNGRINFNDIKYSIRTDLNQEIRNYNALASAKWQFATKSYFESTFTYSKYKNEKFGFNQNVPLWNASIRQLVGKANRIELRLAAFDIFNKNQSVSQTAYQNYILATSANTLARYFLLSIGYNIKGFDIKKN